VGKDPAAGERMTIHFFIRVFHFTGPPDALTQDRICRAEGALPDLEKVVFW